MPKILSSVGNKKITYTAGKDDGKNVWVFRLPLMTSSYPDQPAAPAWTAAVSARRRAGA